MASEAFPWCDMPDGLTLSTSQDFEAFIGDIKCASECIVKKYYFDSLGTLIDLHSRFRSDPNNSLYNAWHSIPVQEFLDEDKLACIGLARKFINVVLLKHPEWEPFIGVTITNEWIREEPAPEAFWTSTSPPSFPEQCREHSLAFLKVSLENGRQAVVFVDPIRSIPIVVTEDGLPPQSSVVRYHRGSRTKEHIVSWDGSIYAKWINRTIKNGNTKDMLLRIYVGGRFLAGNYLEWKNLLFPYRIIMLMNSTNEVRVFLRADVGGKDNDNAIMCVLKDQNGDPKDLLVPFNSNEDSWDESQKFALNLLAETIGFSRVKEYLNKLGVVLNDKAFTEQLMDLWEDNYREIAATYDNLL